MIHVTRGMSKDVKSSLSVIPKGKPNSAKNLEIQHCSSEESPEWRKWAVIMLSITKLLSDFENALRTLGMKRKRDGWCDPRRRTNEQKDLSSNIQEWMRNKEVTAEKQSGSQEERGEISLNFRNVFHRIPCTEDTDFNQCSFQLLLPCVACHKRTATVLKAIN